MTPEEQALYHRTRIESKPEHQAFVSGGCSYCGAEPQKPCDNEKHKQIALAERDRAERIRQQRIAAATAGIPQAKDERMPLTVEDIIKRPPGNHGL